MKKTFILPIVILLLLSLVFISCGRIKPTATEQAAVDSVMAFYGGHYEWKKKQNYLSFTGTYTFKLELSDCPMFKSFTDQMDLLASGIAYRLYTHMGSSNTKYNLFRIGLHTPTEFTRFTFKKDQLQEVEKFMPLCEQSIAEIKTNRYEDLYNHCEHNQGDLPLITLENSKSFCELVDSLVGNITESRFVGFRKIEYPGILGDITLMRIMSSLIGTKKEVTFELTIYPKTGKISGIQF